MSMGPPPAAVQKVPIRETAAAAYRTVFGQLDQLIRAALLPFVLNTLLVAPTLMVAGNTLLSMIMVVITLVPYTLFGVTWHRLALLGKPNAPAVVFPGWQKRHWRFFGFALIVTAINVIIMRGVEIAIGGPPLDESGNVVPEQAMPFLMAMSGGLLAFAYIAVRLSFVFPAAAVDETYGLNHAWAHTKGQGFRLILIVVITVLPVLFIGATLVALIVGAFSPAGGSAGSGSVLVYLLMSALAYVCLALTLAVIATAFRICTGWVPDLSGLPAVPAGDGSDPADREP